MESTAFKELFSERYKIEVKNAKLKNQYGYETAKSVWSFRHNNTRCKYDLLS